MVTVLDSAGLLRRITALDALYLNADRRRTEWLALSHKDDPKAWREAYNRYEAACREYELLRDTPYEVAEGA